MFIQIIFGYLFHLQDQPLMDGSIALPITCCTMLKLGTVIFTDDRSSTILFSTHSTQLPQTFRRAPVERHQIAASVFLWNNIFDNSLQRILIQQRRCWIRIFRKNNGLVDELPD